MKGTIWLSFALCHYLINNVCGEGIFDDLLKVDLKITNISAECKNDLLLLKAGLHSKDVWAIKLLDASGRVGSAFVWGNNYWMGSQHACNRIKMPKKIILSNDVHPNHLENLTEISAPMPIEYKIVYIRHQSKWQLEMNIFDKTIVHLGLCFPASCRNSDVSYLAANMLSNGAYYGSDMLDKNAMIIQTKTLELSDGFFRKPIVMIFCVIMMIFILLNVVGNIFLLLQSKLLRIKAKDLRTMYNHPMINNSISDFLNCFSIIKNAKIITSRSVGKDSIEVIHGLRSIGIIWIIAGHIFLYGQASIDNVQMVLTYAEVWYFQPMFAVAMIVDTYFVISGLVLSYLFFQTNKNQSKNAASKFFKSIINRYLRLTPTYMVVLLLSGFTYSLLQDISPFWMLERNDLTCQKFWWRNILYINNFFPMADMCMNWSWFLSADFQCFVLASFLLLITIKNRFLGISLFSLIFLASCILNGYYGYILQFSLSFDVQYKTADYLYSPTSTRIGPYFVGVFSGWFLSHTKLQWNISKFYLVIGWTVAPILNLILIFGSTNKELTPIEAMFYTALGKTAWAIGIAWIIIACATGNGGFVNKILCYKGLLPYSRMSYTAYLLNPLIITAITMFSETSIHLDFLSLLVASLGYIVIVFSVSFVFMLFFGNCFIRIIKLCRERR